MGTRHLICVVKDDKYVVAQYGQWDGYPKGQGVHVLNFLKMVDIEKFKKKLSLISFATPKQLQKQWVECGADPDSDLVSLDVSNLHGQRYPQNSRDTGAKILDIIMKNDKPMKLLDSIDFASDSLFCEWAYVIDLDKMTLEVYSGFNNSKLASEQRFSYMNKRSEKAERVSKKTYYPIRLVKQYKINQLPSESTFVSQCEKHKGE